MIKWAFKVYNNGEVVIETPQIESANRVFFNLKGKGFPNIRMHLAIVVQDKDGHATEAREDCLQS